MGFWAFWAAFAALALGAEEAAGFFEVAFTVFFNSLAALQKKYKKNNYLEYDIY